MKKLLMALVLMPYMLYAAQWLDPNTGIFWQYTFSGRGYEAYLGNSNDDPTKWLYAAYPLPQGDIEIPRELEGFPVRGIGHYAFNNCSNLTSVTIPSGVADIRDVAFYNCEKLEKVTIPEGVTNVGERAFMYCTNLVSASLPSSVARIKMETFYNCFGLRAANVSEGVTSIGVRAFCACPRLMSVSIPSSVTNIGWMAFSGCDELITVYVARGDAERIRGMLASSDSGLDLDGLTFVEIVDDGGPYTEVVDGIEWTYTVSDGKAQVGGGLGAAISAATAGAVTVPSSLGGHPVTSIGASAFSYCSGLTAVTIPSSVTSIGERAFYNCSGLTSILVDANNSFYSSQDGILYAKDKTSLIQCPGGKTGAVTIPSSVTSIGASAFSHCRGLTSVTIPSSVTSIRSSAFEDCTGLTSVAIPSSVTSIGERAFYGCNILTSVTIPSGVTSIGDDAFSGCVGLTSISLPGRFLVSDVVPDVYYKLRRVTILDGEAILSSDVLGGCGALNSVVISEGVTTLGSNLLSGFRSLEEITLPSTITSIGGYVFDECPSLRTIHVSNNGNIGALKRMLYESGFDVDRVTFDHVDAPDPMVQYTISFDAQGGTPAPAAMVREKGKKYGALPVVSKEGCRFVGWYTDKGVKVLESSVATSDITLYAHWVDAASSADAPAGGRVQIVTGFAGWTVKGLPKGLKFDKSTGEITGVPTGAAGDVVVTFTKKGEEPVEFVISVAAISDNAVGKFNGFVSDTAGNRGTLQLMTTEQGKLTAKVVTAAGSVSFSGKGWDDVSDAGAYSVTLTTKKGDVLALNLDSKAAWDANQVTGTFSSASGRELEVTAQRNAFGKTWYFNATGNESSGWTLSFAPNAKSAALTVTLKADGSTSIAGKLGAIKASASGCANVGGLREGAFLADFAPIVKVGGVKKALSITANLWFDRSDNHPEGVGSAKLVE